MQPRRWSARLPGPAHGAGSNNHGTAPGTGAPSAGSSRSTARWRLRTSRRSPAIGTSATVARIGDQVYATAPGEAFPEVTHAIERSFAASDGVRDVHIVDHGGDQLGYYWDARSGIYPPAQLAQSDFAKYNVGSHLAQDNVDARPRRRRRRSASIRPRRTPYAEIDNPNAFSEPTIQFYPNRVETDDPAVSFYGTAKKAQAAGSASTSIGSTAGTQGDGLVTLGLRRRHGRDARQPEPLHAHVPAPRCLPRAGERHRQPRQDVPLDADRPDRHAAVRGRRPGHARTAMLSLPPAPSAGSASTSLPPTGRSRAARRPRARR